MRDRHLIIGRAVVVAAACVLLAGCSEPVPGGGSGATPATTPSTSGKPAASAAPASAPARQALLGRWTAVATASQGAGGGWKVPYVEFLEDGTWRGSDGCNGQSGSWSLSPARGFEASQGVQTLIGCANVNVGGWLDDARTVQIDGDLLVLRDAEGAETGRLRR